MNIIANIHLEFRMSMSMDSAVFFIEKNFIKNILTYFFDIFMVMIHGMTANSWTASKATGSYIKVFIVMNTGMQKNQNEHGTSMLNTLSRMINYAYICHVCDSEKTMVIGWNTNN